MSFGHQVITIVTYVDGPTKGDLGTYKQVPVPTVLPGCRHRPLTFKETAELQFDVGTQLWKSTLPIGEYAAPVVAMLRAVLPDATITVAGVDYSVIGGVEVFDDFTGPFKATIYSKKHIG